MADLKMLAIDLGASSGRGIVGSFDGEKITLRENHRFSNDPVFVNGRLHGTSCGFSLRSRIPSPRR